jgi:2-oxoglutarate dehydrogenase E2 component (dihydrolipoamide succinyltransferase)
MDDEILELETDKVNQVLYAPQAGVITLTVKPDEVVKIGQVIGFVDSEQTATTTPTDLEDSSKKAQEKPAPAEEKIVEAEPKKEPQVLARQTKEEWLKELKSPPAEASAKKEEPKRAPVAAAALGKRSETRTKMSKIRKLIAARLVEVQQATAMLTTFNEVGMSAINALREKYKESFMKEHEVKLGFMSFFVKACTSALQNFPEVNSYIDGDDIVHREYIDIGIAVGTEKGLIVPVVRDCNLKSFASLEQDIEGFAKKARSGGLSADDLQGGGFTITNGGVYGSLLSTPILNPPQCAILGMHKIMKRPVVVDDQIVIRPMMYVALSYDHRIIDGKEAVSFLVHVKNLLEDPSRLLLEV